MINNQYDDLMKLILQSNKIVALTGAGISTASGIEDFRSAKGVYVDPTWGGKRVFDINVFKEDPTIFGTFFSKFFSKIQNAQPSKGHLMLKKIEDMGKLLSIITQNIDGLHYKAGNKNVIEVHGHIRDFVCTASILHRIKIEAVEYTLIKEGQAVVCDKCGQYMKPNIVFFGEHVKDLEKALTEVQKADLLLVIGTSLSVYPIADLPTYCKDKTKLVIINDTETQYDHLADLILQEDIEFVVEKLGFVKQNVSV